MKVYVITCGSYSDYHICAVTLDPERAEQLQDRFTDRWDEARIEEYDTDKYDILPKGKNLYVVTFYESDCAPIVREIECQDLFIDDLNVVSDDDNKYFEQECSVTVAAKDEDSAIKIAAEMRAEYYAAKYGIS